MTGMGERCDRMPVPCICRACRVEQSGQRQARERVAKLFAPGRAPETIELDYVVDTGGMLVAILVRDIATGRTIARVEADDLWRLAGDEAVSGMLMERRG